MTGQSTKKKSFRMRLATIGVLMVLSTATASCTPGQIEGAFTDLATPFESGYNFDASGAGLMISASLVLSYLTPGLSLGPF